MPVKPTSLDAYNELLAEGLITERGKEVLRFIWLNQDQDGYGGMATRADIEMHFRDTTSSYGPRLGELEAKGLVYVAGTKQSVKTGRMVQGWRVTNEYDADEVKSKPVAGKTTLKQLAETIDDLVLVTEASLGMRLKDAVTNLLAKEASNATHH